MTHPSIETFDIELGFPTGVRVFRGGVVSDYKTGVLMRRQTLSSVFPTGQAARRTWQVRVEAAGVEDYQRALDLWNETGGGCEALDLTVRGTTMDGSTDETVQVRMLDSPLRLNSVGPRTYAFELVLEEFPHAP